MITELETARSDYINKVIKNLDYESAVAFREEVAKAHVKYAFSKDFERQVEEEVYRELHPALKDLYDQYKEIEALLKREEEENK